MIQKDYLHSSNKLQTGTTVT